MKKINFSQILWALCLTVFPMTVWPLLYAATTIGVDPDVAVVFREPDAGMALGYLIPCVVMAWLGAGAALLRRHIALHNEDERRWKTVLGNIITAVPYAAAVIWCGLHFELELGTPVALAASIFCVFHAERHAADLYVEMLSRTLLVVSLGMGVGALLIFLGTGMPYDAGALIWPFFIEAVACAVAQNQGNIDFMMQRRKHDLRHLPRRIRWYSLSVTGGVLVLILAVVLLRPQITWLFGEILGVVKVILRYILMAVLWLAGLGGDGNDEVGGQEGSSGGMEGLGDASAQANPWWDYIMYTVLIALGCFLLWTYRRYIIRAIRDFFRRIANFIRDKLFAVPAVQKLAEAVAGKSEYYTDETETLAPEEYRELREEVFRLRDWRRKVKRLNGEPASPERYRKGYGLGVEWLQWKGVGIVPADTPADILDKAKKVLPPESWGEVTEFYELVRYGEQDAPAAAQEKLFGLLTALGKK